MTCCDFCEAWVHGRCDEGAAAALIAGSTDALYQCPFCMAAEADMSAREALTWQRAGARTQQRHQAPHLDAQEAGACLGPHTGRQGLILGLQRIC